MGIQSEAVIAVVPAAGIGRRMGAQIPKQYLMLNEQSILAHTLDCLLSHPQICQVVVALHPDDNYFHTLPQSQHPQLCQVVGGGERADSVLAALHEVDEGAWVLVHDAARPCLSHDDIDKLLLARQQFPQGVILGSPVRDTMKRSTGRQQICETVSRDHLWHALTPQCFRAGSLKRNITLALSQKIAITDDASAMEWAGTSPGIIEGRADNIKVTHPNDLALASLFLDNLLK
ncbi:2-C-methyl-D-erythritol 4-phosphate cytidylyltransferase [Shewanella surugensis]|uniref:2-C-methyl-D-erythritol 4-phosphate cytidylyltransferase n=1 Tax=Shewanella surugensis TaxID=212020 RepID=A0ABT0L8V9_9GAMM|nr:2-C-methyl-D-erythritol 4-phosphate cytidylyltransferase [Shewanella surugensis]MCL1123984.1 2-C-methyl-D-erythritol 4-phosphate cytidylyltransferase [Shewanella surugensis]